MIGRSLELYFIDGTPDGLLTAEVFGWTGHILKIPRLRLKEALSRAEARHTGVYLLLGETEEGPRAYVGEAESVAKRIRDHDAARDWWGEAIVLTTSSDALHKAHVKYLESRLVEIAKQAGTATLENGNIPPRSSLNEAAEANMEAFLDTVLMVLPALGVDVFRSGARVADRITPPAETAQMFTLSTPKNKVEGRARLEGSDFVVLEGSKARLAWAGKGDHDFGYKQLHAKLVANGVLQQGPEHAVFTQDYAFNSPSAAAAVMNGRPANGRLEWKHGLSGETFGEWEQREVQKVETS